MEKNDCEVCFRIRCKQCGWVAAEEDVVRIQRGEMVACPVCGWKPKNNVKLKTKNEKYMAGTVG